jgi:hypothetical protein
MTPATRKEGPQNEPEISNINNLILPKMTHPQVTSNESYVSVLNHCFDDIEKFILRIQHAYAAMRELQAKKRHTKRSAALAASQSNKSHLSGPLPPMPPPLSASELALLSAQARGPSADDFFEILSKFKLAFNLLAKLKGCIHEPNAPELVHFLFTPLAIIIESARNGKFRLGSQPDIFRTRPASLASQQTRFG